MEQISGSELRKWRVLSWMVVVGLLGLGIWWMFSLPTVGKGGIFLAVGATLMPLFWEKIGAGGKMSWIAMLFLLLSVEYRAIDKEHTEYANDQRAARKEERDSFDDLLKTQQAGVQAILDQQNRSLRGILDQEQKHFERTFSNAVKVQRQEKKTFTNLLVQQQGLFAKQQDLFSAQQEFSEAFAGRLVPANDPTPLNACTKQGLAPKEDDVVVIIGNNASIVNRFPHPVLQINGHNVVSLDRNPATGTITLEIDSRDSNGEIAFRMDKNGTVVRDAKLFALHPNKSTFLIQDEYGGDVLTAQFVNPHTFRITGKFSYCGRSIPFQASRFSNGCDAYSGGGSMSEWINCPKSQQ